MDIKHSAQCLSHSKHCQFIRNFVPNSIAESSAVVRVHWVFGLGSDFYTSFSPLPKLIASLEWYIKLYFSFTEGNGGHKKANINSYYNGFTIILRSFIGHVNTVQTNSVSARSLVSNHILKIYLGTLGSNFPKVVGYYVSKRNTEWEEIPESHRIFISIQEFLNWWLVSSRSLCLVGGLSHRLITQAHLP